MSEPAHSWWDELRQEAEVLPAEPPRTSKGAAIGGAVAAAAIAVGLGWWFTTSESSFQNRETARLQPTAVAPLTAPSDVDLEQVRRARDEFDATMAGVGHEGLARFRESCEASARADGRILDFCLAFDLMGDTVTPPDAGAEARRLALVEAAVPGEPAPAKIVVTTAKPPPAKAVPAASRCRLLSTPADRLICANPGLKTQHARMRAAYEAALENGANPLVIDRGQADWRALRNTADTRQELAALYAQRIRELNAAAEEARLTPPN